MIIEVTQEDIDDGFAEHCQLCPIALALARARFKRPNVYSDHFLHGEMYNRQRIELPESCHTFIAQFDTSKPVQPFSFEIDL